MITRQAVFPGRGAVIEIRKLTGLFGAEITGAEHSLTVIRGQTITPENHLALACPLQTA